VTDLESTPFPETEPTPGVIASPSGSSPAGTGFEVLEAAPSQAYVVGPDYRILYVNAHGRRMLRELGADGGIPADVVEHPIGASFAPFYLDPILGTELFRTPERLPIQLPREQVGERVLQGNFSAVHDAAGRYLGALVLWEDLTEQARREREVGRLTSMVENSPTKMMFADRDFIIQYMNPASLEALRTVEEFLPVRADQVVGSSMDLFHTNPAYQRNILSDPTQLPRRAQIGVGRETLDLLISPIRDADGVYIGAMATWDVITERLRAEQERADAEADTTAVNQVLVALQDAHTVEQAIGIVLDTVRSAFGWAYGSFWKIGEDQLLRFVQDSGDAGPEFRRVTLEASFARGVGLSGRTWAQRDLYFTPDLGEMTDCVRASAAQRVGVKSGVCFPILTGGEVIGTMDFFVTETLAPSSGRLEALRNIGRLVSQTVERLERGEREREAAERNAEGVARILATARAAAAGDLAHDLEVTGDDAVGQVAQALRELLATLRASLGEIGGTADTLTSSSEQLAVLAQGMGDGASLTSDRASSASSASVQISASIQTVATAAEEMTASIREIAKNATEAASVATDAVTVASGAQATVASLGESSAEIGQVIKVITSIAQQTNLLALNATIEAARAGDAGKGFAVVANEVKELAKETAKATEDISQKIEAIQSDTQGAVSAIAKITEVIGRINDIQTTIASAVEEQTATTNEIARSVTEAAGGANGIAEDVTQVANAAADTRQGAHETLNAATQLADLAAELKTLVGQFAL
jgi:methyl-accepting chemotaxis protein